MDHKNVAGLDLIVGPMYSNKTGELLRRLSTVTEVGMQALYINHSLDNRNQQDVFSTHNPQFKDKLSDGKIKMISVDDLLKIKVTDIAEADVVGIDEVHFFSDLGIVLTWVENCNKRVIVAGLDGDYKRQKFGHILDLVPWCDTIVKLTAYCTTCARAKVLRPALFTHYHSIKKDKEIVEVGAHEKYSSVCRECYLLLNHVEY